TDRPNGSDSPGFLGSRLTRRIHPLFFVKNVFLSHPFANFFCMARQLRLVSSTSAKSARRGPKHEGRPHPKVVGDASQAMVLGRLVQAGRTVLVPFGENTRYDYVIEEKDGSFTRVQVKTGRLRKGAIVFATCSTSYHHPNNRGMVAYKHCYRGQADLFGVYCPETDAIYLVPVSEVGTTTAALRVESTRNNQSKKIRWASDYEVRPG
ncbi:MAG: group I intron-associated PD-(D/E)XK endonuclease, partial [Acidimicrobiia bacterium]